VCKHKCIMPEDMSFISQRPSEEPGDESLEAWERIYIAGKLDQYEWNISHTAQALKIDRGTLYSKIKKYGLSRE
jgi:DNA-binding NtrC family response regulator